MAYGGEGNRVVVRKTATGEELDAWAAADNNPGWVWTLAFSPSEDALVAACTRGVRLWKLRKGRRFGDAHQIGTPEDHGKDVRKAVFSRDGRTILTGGQENNFARVWDADTGQPRTPWLEHGGAVLAVALSPDGLRAATASADHTARLWNATNGKRLATLPHNNRVQAIAFSPDGRRIATGCDDGTARLWDASNGGELGGVIRHDGPVTRLVFSPDSTTLLTGSDDATARLWTLPHPVQGSDEQILTWMHIQTGIELGADDAIRVLNPKTWRTRRARLEELGGPPR